MLHLMDGELYTPAMQNSRIFSSASPIYKVLIILFFLVSTNFMGGYAHSANSLSGINKKISQKDAEHIKEILKLPPDNRVALLQNYGSSAFVVLRSFVFSNQLSMQIRWHSLVSLAQTYPHTSVSVVESALRSSTWFLRNAGLIAMEFINIEQALHWAGELLNDPALVVRTAAVKMIRKHKASQYKYLLAHKLNAEDSFYKDKSLWIRHHIVYALADFSLPGEEQFFISLLRDEDRRLYPPAIIALEKLTQKSFRSTGRGKQRSSERQKYQWMSWWSKRQQNLFAPPKSSGNNYEKDSS